MTDLRTAAQQALEALEAIGDEWGFTSKRTLNKRFEAVDALRAAVAEPVQEPVAWVWNPVSEAWERVRAFGQWQCGAIYAFGPTAPAALAEPVQEPVQEPVAWVECDGDLVWNNREAAIGRNLYISPQPQQTEPSQDTPPQHEYEVTANDDGTFSVALPDGEELRIIPPQRKPLSEEEIWALYYALPSDDFERSDRIDFARAIERAYGIG